MDNHFFRRAVLPNGVRILTSAMPNARSASVSLYVGAGSRYESDGEAGLSHFLEHLLFKGTSKRPSSKEIAEAIDGVGGVMNGGTDRELTVYYAKVARQHLDLALDVVTDLVRNPLLEESEFEKERQVVLEELAMVADSPQQLSDLLLDATMWPDQPLGRDVAGTPESVSALNRDMTIEYLGRQYVANNAVVAVAGDIDHAEVLRTLEALLGDWPAGDPGGWSPARDGAGPRCAVRYKTTEQAHINVALRGLPLNHPDRYPLAFLSAILGEGMSSRLFLELREHRALAYDVHSYVSHFLDTGAFIVYAGVDPKNAVEAVKAVLEEVARLRDEGPTAEELTKARELSKGRLLLRMEDTRAVSGWIGGQEILLNRVRTLDEVLEEMESVTLEDLLRVARELLVADGLHLAIVGPFRSDKRFEPLIRL
jgi:predicted Zn-dependent peptidase